MTLARALVRFCCCCWRASRNNPLPVPERWDYCVRIEARCLIGVEGRPPATARNGTGSGPSGPSALRDNIPKSPAETLGDAPRPASSPEDREVAKEVAPVLRTGLISIVGFRECEWPANAGQRGFSPTLPLWQCCPKSNIHPLWQTCLATKAIISIIWNDCSCNVLGTCSCTLSSILVSSCSNITTTTRWKHDLSSDASVLQLV